MESLDIYIYSIKGYIAVRLVEALRYKRKAAGSIPDGVIGYIYTYSSKGYIAVQLVEALRYKRKVAGSIPDEVT